MGDLKYWNDRVYVLAGFVESQEFKNLCDRYGIKPGSIEKERPLIWAVNVSDYVDVLGFLNVTGEVINNSAKTLYFAKVYISFYDINNLVVDTKVGFASPSVINPGGKSTFKIGFIDNPETIVYYTYYPEWYEY